MEIKNKISTSKDILSILRNKQFLGLWISQVFSQLSTHIVNFALITKIFSKTGSSIAISLLVFWFATPAVLMGVLAGVYVDRWDRKKILILINFFQALLVLGYFFIGEKIILIYPIVFIYAALNQFFIPSEGAMIPTIVPRENLLLANSFYLFTNHASFILGYILAGPLIMFLGNNSPFFIASSMLFLATLAVMILPDDSQRAKNFRLKNKRTSVFFSVKKGLSFIKNNKKISFSIIHLILVQVVISAIIALGPSFAKNSLHISIESVGFALIAPAGMGVIIGAFVINKIKEKYKLPDLVRFGVIFASLVMFLLTITHKIGPFIKKELFIATNGILTFKFMNLFFTVFLLVVLLGFFVTFIVIPSQTILQKETPSNFRGRIFGITGMLINITALIPLMIFGILADLFSAAVVLGGIGILIFLWGIFFELKAEKRALG